MVSYFDSLIGRIINTLKKCDFYENTYIFIVADHGEMLGERGTWFKFLPFEWSVRVPMIASGPNMVKGKIEKHYTSLVDLLPTFVDIASNGKTFEFPDNIDGKSLLGLMRGDKTEMLNELMLEFTGEGVYAPALIFIRDGIKYIHCRTDPPMMFDLNEDPNETKNLAADPSYSNLVKEMKSEIDKRWNYDELEQKIIKSQKRRLFVQSSLLKGKWTGWDHQPFVDAKKAYVRGAIDPNTTATKARKRYPFVETIEPHNPRKN
jgi:choline-sulfatase